MVETPRGWHRAFVGRRSKGELDEIAFRRGLGKRLKEARALSGMPSAAELARRTGLEYQATTKYCRGEIEPLRDALVKLAAVCNVTLDWLVLGIDHIPSTLYGWIQDRKPGVDMQRLLVDVPVHGYRAPFEFWDHVQTALREGKSGLEASVVARRTIEMERRARSKAHAA